ncbi:MAG: oligosaccharide flippase family protein [Muribaculaceae bacterium]|nr:oligosaccharide flippase family protein [Muribaculaceae bacterium]
MRRWSWALGIAGASLMLAMSGVLSRFSFGDNSHTGGFMLLSVCVLFSSLSSAEGAVFRGFRRFRKLARASVWGAVGGLAVSLPMFYFWGQESIVPSIIAYTVVTWIALGLYREKVGRPTEPLAFSDSLAMGKGFVVLGVFMTASMFACNLVSYLFLAWLNKGYGEDAVGLYQAGFTLVNKYVGLVFTAIAVEYYPRLSAVAHSSRRMSLFASHEIRLLMWILMGAVPVFVIVAGPVVRLLYSSDFLEMLPFVILGAVGTVFRAYGWCVAFAILARGDGATYLWTEVLSSLVSLALNVVAFSLWGWAGLGIAYIIWYAAYAVVVSGVSLVRYDLRVSVRVVALTAVAAVAASGMALVTLLR